MAAHSDTDHASKTRRGFLKSAGITGALVGAFGVELWLLQNDGTGDVTTFLLDGRIEGWDGVAPGDIAGTRNPTLTLQAGETYRLLWQNDDGAAHNFEIRDSTGSALEVLVPLDVNQESAKQRFQEAERRPAGNDSDSDGVDDSGNATAQPSNETANATTPETETVGNATTPENETSGNETGTQEPETISTTELLSERNAVQGVEFTATEEMAQYICPIHPTTMVGDIELADGDVSTDNTTE